jgi:hypothetical protein
VSVEPTEELTDAPFREGDAGIGRAVVVDAIAVGVSVTSASHSSRRRYDIPQLCVYRTLTFSARGPFGPWPTVNETD